MMRRANTLATLASAFALSACLSPPQMPDPWPAAAAQDCSAIAGSYAQTGETSGSGYQPYLSAFFFPVSVDRALAQRAYPADRVELTWQAGGVLRVRAMRGAEELASRQISRGDSPLACDHGALVIDMASGTADERDRDAGVEESRIALVSGADGSLIVKRSDDVGGAAIYLSPVVAGEVSWYRFHRTAAP